MSAKLKTIFYGGREIKLTPENQKILEQIKIKEKELEMVKGTECEIYSRIVGYFRPTKQWNPGKVEEFKDREEFG